MYCTKCGAQNDNDYRFCTKCGTDLRTIDTVKVRNTDIKKPGIGRIITVICIIIITSAALIFIFSGTNISQTTQNQTEVLISSVPPGANIYINNVSIGNAPIKINLPGGNYSIKINLSGYNGIISYFNITSDMARQEISAILEPVGNKSIN